MKLTHEEVLDLLPAYTVGALEESEQQAVDQYITAQHEFLQDVKRAESATTLLAQSAGEKSLPDGAKHRMMSHISGDLGTAQPGALRPETAPAILPSAHRSDSHNHYRDVPPPRRNAPIAQQQPQKESWWGQLFNTRTMVNALAGAALVAVVFLSYFEAIHLNEIDSLREEAHTVTEQLNIAQNRASSAESTISSLQERLNVLETANNEFAQANAELVLDGQELAQALKQDQERITLVGAANRAEIMFGTEEAPGLQGAFYLSGTDGAIVVHGLKPLPSEKTYQFWLVLPDGRQIPATLVPVHGDQEPTWARFALPEEVPSFTAVGISIEPAGGSPAPTGPMLLASEIG